MDTYYTLNQYYFDKREKKSREVAKIMIQGETFSKCVSVKQ